MRRVALALFGTIAGLVGLLTFKTHPASVATPPAAVSTTGSGSDTTGSAGSTGTGSDGTAATAPSTSSSPSSSSSASKTVTGDAIDTRYGPVQVRITVRNGKVVSATAVEYPTQDPRDAQINAYAIPVLQQESVGVSNSNSEGYAQSLQSALDKAGL
jgi:uncharacterized protein with FMN-binding domain